MGITATQSSECQPQFASAPFPPRTLIRNLAITALLAYAVALAAPAIHDHGYKEGAAVIVDEHAVSGLGCLFGAMFWGIFDRQLLIYPLVSILFLISTIQLLRANSPFPLVRGLIVLCCAIAPLHFVLTTGYALYFGSYVWLLAFTLSCLAHWLHLLQSIACVRGAG